MPSVYFLKGSQQIKVVGVSGPQEALRVAQPIADENNVNIDIDSDVTTQFSDDGSVYYIVHTLPKGEPHPTLP